jgi:MFS family permease
VPGDSVLKGQTANLFVHTFPVLCIARTALRLDTRVTLSPSRPSLTSLQRARLSTATCFFVFGALLSSWVSRIPVVQHQLHLNSAQLGIALLGAPIGQVLALQLMPGFVHRWSSASAARWAVSAAGGCLIILGLARNLTELTVGLALFGAALGALDISMNTQGVAVERRYERPIMSGLHGVYSVGVLAGSSLGALAAALGVDPLAHFTVVACLFTAGTAFGTRDLLGPSADDVVDAGSGAPTTPSRGIRLREHPVLIAAGVVAFCSLFAEGAVDNWSGVFLHQVRHSSFAIAPLGLAMTSIGMAIGRFTGDAVIARWGRSATLFGSSLLSSGGMLIALVGGSVPAALAGYAVFGLGVATIVPIAFTVAGNTAGVPPAWALARASTMGYVGQLSSPAVIGLVAHATGLATALVIPTVLLLAVAPLSRIAGRR